MSHNIKTFFLNGVASLALSMISDKSDARRRHPSAGLASDRFLEHLNTRLDAIDALRSSKSSVYVAKPHT